MGNVSESVRCVDGYTFEVVIPAEGLRLLSNRRARSQLVLSYDPVTHPDRQKTCSSGGRV